MKNKFLIFLLFTIYSLLFAIPTAAQSPSPDLQSTPSAEEVLGDKIKEIREKVKEAVREKIEEVKKGPKRAYFGKILKIGDTSITIDTATGEKEISLTAETKIDGKAGKEIELKDLAVEMYVICMGYLKDNTLEARRIVVVTKPKIPAREVAFGRVTDISNEEKLLTVKNEKKGLTYSVEITNKTKITKKSDSKIVKAQFSDIKKDDRIIAIGTPTENEEKLITAKIVHIIPGLAKVSASPTDKQEKPKVSVSPAPTTALEPEE